MFRVDVVLLFLYFCAWVSVSEAFTSLTPTRSHVYHHNRVNKDVLLSSSPSSSAETDDAAAAYQVSIEYCTGCRWGLRAFWMAQELLTTFADDSALQAITLIPSKEAGRFLVQCYDSSSSDSVQLWDRTVNDGFPEMKELKQLVRDQIDPDRFLGHSDSEKRKQKAETGTSIEEKQDDTLWKEENDVVKIPTVHGTVAPHLSILYCTGCRWMLRSAYFAQELLSTFAEDINSITLIPSRPPSPGGSFVVMLDGTTVIWDRAEKGCFPETKELKQLVRDQLNPSKDLGHSDRQSDVEEIDEDEAADARNFFGVA